MTIIQLASVNDPEVPYKPGDKGSYEPLPMTTLVAELHAAEKCPAKSTVTHSGDMTLTTWSGCADGTRLGFAVWPGGVHSFPAAARQRARGRPGHLVLLHARPRSPRCRTG